MRSAFGFRGQGTVKDAAKDIIRSQTIKGLVRPRGSLCYWKCLKGTGGWIFTLDIAI